MQVLKSGDVKLSKRERAKLVRIVAATDPSLDFLTDDIVDGLDVDYATAYKIVRQYT